MARNNSTRTNNNTALALANAAAILAIPATAHAAPVVVKPVRTKGAPLQGAALLAYRLAGTGKIAAVWQAMHKLHTTTGEVPAAHHAKAWALATGANVGNALIEVGYYRKAVALAATRQRAPQAAATEATEA